MTLLAVLIACSGTTQDTANPPGAADPEFVALSDLELARRISLDLRGITPSIDELDLVESSGLDPFLDAVLADPQHEERLADLFAERWLTRIDEYNVPAEDFGLTDTYTWLRSVSDEPLRLMAYVGARDLPWTETVTADYTMANDTLLAIFPMEALDGEATTGWRRARYTDDRPAGGVLTSNGLWWKYDSTLNNFNRGRALALARLVLCHDFLERPVEFAGITEFTTEALLEATRTVPSCEGCHSAVDPLASALFGLWWFDDKDFQEMRRYHPEREPLGESYLDLQPTWFGTPMTSSAELGLYAANDPRFVRCAVEQVAGGLWRRSIAPEDHDALNELEDAFRDGDLRLSVLIRATVATDEYRAAMPVDEESGSSALTPRLMTPDQLASAIEALTGYRWTQERWDMLGNDVSGYRVMMGGVDADQVTHLNFAPSVPRSLATRRLSQLAAAAIVEADLAAEPAERRLFSADLADLEALEPGSAELASELTHLRRRLYGARPTEAQLAEDEALWSAVRERSDPATAWRSVLSVLLRDPQFWSY